MIQHIFSALRPFAILSVLSLVLAACTSTPPIPEVEPELSPEQQLNLLYEQVQRSPSPASEQARMQAAELLLELGRLDEAQSLLEPMDIATLPETLKVRFVLVSADLALYYFDGARALTLLQQEEALLTRQNTSTKTRVAQLASQAYQLQEQHVESARVLEAAWPWMTEAARANSLEQIWQRLMEAPIESLVASQNLSSEDGFQGWLELAALTKVNQDDLDKLSRALGSWRQSWPAHPATADLPQELGLLSTMVSERPQKVTLMLPLKGATGAYGRAIRDGLLAAYYASLQAESYTPQISILDTSTSDSFAALYQQAVDAGADMIIGPLDKDSVRLLQSSQALPVPTLALNYTEAGGSASNLYQFGLSAEDEARQVAQHAWQSGYRSSLVIADASWGRRIAAAFADEWQRLSGTLLEVQYFSSDSNFSDPIRLLLNLDNSEQRVQRLRSVIGAGVVTTPRRRQDMDFIFMVANAVQARQIKPTLAFHFAGNVPVYAISYTYSGATAGNVNRDLDGVIFCETPWLLEYTGHPLKQSFDRLWPTTADSADLSRLFALGVDAYRLIPRVKQLAQIEDSRIDGATGSLSMNQDGQLVRQLLWARIQGGQARPLQ